MRIVNLGWVAVLLLSLSGKAVSSQQPPVPPAVKAFCKRLGHAQSMTFTAQFFDHLPLASGGMSSDLRPLQTFQVKARRPNFLAYECSPIYKVIQVNSKGQQFVTTKGDFTDKYRANGSGAIGISTPLHVYTKDPPLKSLDEMPMDPFFTTYIFYPDPLDGFNPAPEELLHGRKCVILKDKGFQRYAGGTKMYFDKESGELLQISVDGINKEGKEVEGVRVEYSHWQFDVKFPDSTFDITPPPDTKPLSSSVKPSKP